MQKIGPPNVPRKQVRISIGIIDFIAYSILKNIEILLNQGVVQSQPNWYPILPVRFGPYCKKNGPSNVPRKKSYFGRNYRPIRLFYFEKYGNFIESGGCSKASKLISQTTNNVWAVMQKEWSA